MCTQQTPACLAACVCAVCVRVYARTSLHGSPAAATSAEPKAPVLNYLINLVRRRATPDFKQVAIDFSKVLRNNEAAQRGTDIHGTLATVVGVGCPFSRPAGGGIANWYRKSDGWIDPCAWSYYAAPRANSRACGVTSASKGSFTQHAGQRSQSSSC